MLSANLYNVISLHTHQRFESLGLGQMVMKQSVASRGSGLLKGKNTQYK